MVIDTPEAGANLAKAIEHYEKYGPYIPKYCKSTTDDSELLDKFMGASHWNCPLNDTGFQKRLHITRDNVFRRSRPNCRFECKSSVAKRSGGQGEIRTRDLYNANVAIFQLIYLPSW